MAIKRLAREASFPCIGKLRKGGAKQTREKNGKKYEVYGEDLTYFRFDTTDERAAKMFHAVYGDEPSEINVYLPHQSAEQNFTCWQEAYLAGGLQHRCDGETCVLWLSPNGKIYHTDPKPCPGGCKEVGRLMVIIPELQRFAFVTVETHSINDIMTLTENLQAVEYLRGDLRGIPFVLKRRPKEISTPTADGKRARREKWLLSIEVDPAWAALQLDSMRQAALTVNGVTVDDSRLLSTAYVDEDDDEVEGEVVPTTGGHLEGDEPDTLPALVAEWLTQEKPGDAAKLWAVEIGAQDNVFAAGNSMKKITNRDFGGIYNPENRAQILTAFYFRQQEKLNEVTIDEGEALPVA